MFLILLCISVVLLLTFLYQKYRKMPPGPYGLPIVGYYPFLGTDQMDSLHRLSKRYPDVMSINLLGEDYWVLNSLEAVQEALVTKGDHFSGRSKTEFQIDLNLGINTFIAAEGEEWKVQMKFILGHLSQLGMGKSQFEVTLNNLIDEVEHYIEYQNGKPHDYYNSLSTYVANVSTAMIFSNQLKEDDYLNLMKSKSKLFASVEFLGLVLTGKLYELKYKLNTKLHKIVTETHRIYKEYAERLVDKRMKTFDADNCQDLLDFWIRESQGANRKYFKFEHVTDNIAAMIFASQGASVFLYHSLYHMAAHAEIQDKVYQEIVDTIGVDRDFCFIEKERLPYTQAVIAEVHRFGAVAGVGSVHWNRGATKLRGYDIPKRQKVIANIYALSRNPKYFKNPDEFDPSNFLDENGWYKPNKASIPFGTGSRMCIGVKLADVEIYLAFVRLMRKFKWIKSESTTTNEGSIRVLAPFKVSARRRQ